MASAFSHALAAGALGAAFYRPGWPTRFWILGAACAVIPDADVFGVHVGIPFGSELGHRGLSHSLMFAAVLGGVVVALAFSHAGTWAERSRLWLYFFLATVSHGVLDAFTNGGPGIAFLAPFDDSRFFFPFRPIQVSPIGVAAFFSEWGFRVIQNEALWIGLPCLAFTAVVVTVRRRA